MGDLSLDVEHGPEAFQFAAQAREAAEAYAKVRPLYVAFADLVKETIAAECRAEGLIIHSVEARAKSRDSFRNKAEKPDELDPSQPRYPHPLGDITDLAGIRVITFFLETLQEVDALLVQSFDVVSKRNKSEVLEKADRWGYKSIHYLVRLAPSHPSFERFGGFMAEVQVRTLLQHAWAEIEHDIRYKASISLPRQLLTRFTALAGLLEIADREFQSIHDDASRIRHEAADDVRHGRFTGIELTPEVLELYLDIRLGDDARITPWSYRAAVRLLMMLGFSTLKQVDDCICTFDDTQVSKVVWGKRRGQMQRFEDLLLAGMGEVFIERHPACRLEAGQASQTRKALRARLKRLQAAGVPTRHYDPLDPER